jgi:hypothetical protein
VNSAAVTWVCKWPYYNLAYIPLSICPGSYGRCIFSFLRDLHTAFLSGRNNLSSHQQCISVPFSSHLHRHFYVAGVIEENHSDWSKVKSQCFYHLHFFFYCCARWGYIVAFIKVLTMYQIYHS